jgi:putative ABC transport system permease protein
MFCGEINMLTSKDFKTAFNSLLKAKGYVVTVVLTLGITLGALVAMFNLNYQLLAKPLPYPDQERLYLMKGDSLFNGQMDLENMYPYSAAIEAYKNNRDFFDINALVYFGTDIIRSLADAPLVTTSYVTPEYLQMANVSVALGRSFNADEGLDSQLPVTIISYRTWQEIFNKSPDVLGKTLRFGEVDFKIIGVTSQDFIEPQLMNPGRVTQVWLPWDYNILSPNYRSWRSFNINQYLVGKLKIGQQASQVEQAITSSLNDIYKLETTGRAAFAGTSIKFTLISYREAILGDSKGRILLLLVGSVVMTLIAAANIINLVLARAANQQRSMAIKAALGAQKFHLFNLVLAEILLLIAPAIVLSLLVALGGIQLLQVAASHLLPRLTELSLSVQSLSFSIVSALMLALVFALLVSRQINYRTLNHMLQSSGKGVGLQISSKVRQLLILTQVMLTGILVAASAQILQQSLRHIEQPLGFATQDLYQIQINDGTQRDSPPEEQKNNLIAIRNQFLLHPKVANASLTSDFPISSDKIIPWFSYLSVDADFLQQKQGLLTQVDENFLEIVGAEWVSGRHFTADEFQTDATGVIVNETFARQLQADGDVLHKRYYWLNSHKRELPYEVIGVVRDFSLPNRAELPRFFIPQASVRFPRFLLQLKPHQEITKLEINKLMEGISSQYKVSELRSMSNAHELLIAQDKLTAGLTAALSFIALSLAAIGIYGVLSYSVQLRRFELGIRMAIGARPNTIFLQILKDNLAPVIIGLLFALAVLISFWLWIQQTNYNLQTSGLGWLLPPVLIIALTAATSLLSVWQIIRKPASKVLRGD